MPPWNVQDDGEGKRGDDIARQSCSGRVGPEAILSWTTESLILILMIKMVALMTMAMTTWYLSIVMATVIRMVVERKTWEETKKIGSRTR